MKKEIIKSFDLEAYKNGAKVRTRGGHEVRIICTDAKNPFSPIVALISLSDGCEIAQSYTSKGKKQLTKGVISDDDLVIVEEVEVPEFWSDKEKKASDGYFFGYDSNIVHGSSTQYNQKQYKYFASKKQAKSALAMARISQIMANDIEHFGGVVTDEEWKNNDLKHVIYRFSNNIYIASAVNEYFFLAFHTVEQRNLFLDKYRDLVREYMMLD